MLSIISKYYTEPSLQIAAGCRVISVSSRNFGRDIQQDLNLQATSQLTWVNLSVITYVEEMEFLMTLKCYDT